MKDACGNKEANFTACKQCVTTPATKKNLSRSHCSESQIVGFCGVGSDSSQCLPALNRLCGKYVGKFHKLSKCIQCTRGASNLWAFAAAGCSEHEARNTLQSDFCRGYDSQLTCKWDHITTP
jgi:hypothetical protein